MNLAYMDAGVWVAYGIGADDRHYDEAKELVERVVTGELVAIVSLLSLLETIDVIRKRVVDKVPRKSLDNKSDQEKKELIQQISEQKYNALIGNIQKAVKANQMILVDFKDLDVGDILTHCSAILKEKFGNILFFDRCSRCWQPKEHYEYKGLCPVDAMHITLAKKIGCNYFYTTDKSFRHLLGDPSFSSIRIEIIN